MDYHIERVAPHLSGIDTPTLKLYLLALRTKTDNLASQAAQKQAEAKLQQIKSILFNRKDNDKEEAEEEEHAQTMTPVSKETNSTPSHKQTCEGTFTVWVYKTQKA